MSACETPVSARRQADQILQSWSKGEPADTLAALSRFPHLQLDKSVVLDLAYEEYCVRRDRGESINANDYCTRFPDYRASLRRLIEAHEFFEASRPELNEAPAFQWPAAGDHVAGYRVVRQLGRGAFARVYLAWHEDTNRQVVVKLTLAGGAEARLAGPLTHDAIVPILDARTLSTGASCVVMPFLGCATLHDLLDVAFPPGGPAPMRADLIAAAQRRASHPDDRPQAEPRLGPDFRGRTYFEAVTRLLAELARGLAFLHRRGIRHRDLKPSNVLLGWDGRPIILDFNLSEDAGADRPHAGGTLAYMAPEQIQSGMNLGQPLVFDERADLFSFGVIAYELLTGIHPFGAPASRRTPSQEPPRTREVATWLLGQHRSAFRPVRERSPDVDPALARLIERCLSFAPDPRPSAEILSAELAQLLRWPHRLGRGIRNNRVIFGVAVAVALAFLVGVVAVAAMRPSAEQRNYTHAVDLFHQGKLEQAADSLDAVLTTDRRNASAYFLRGLTYLRREDFANAHNDFKRAFDLNPAAKTAAYIAYCRCCQQLYAPSLQDADFAEEHGFCSAALYNNRGAAYLRGEAANGPISQNLERARQDLDKAIELDESLAEAYFNRACLEYGLWRRTKAIADLNRAVADIDKAMQGKHLGSIPYTKAAEAYAHHPVVGPANTDRILSFLRSAAERGRDPRLTVQGSAAFAPFLQRPEFQALLTARVGPKKTDTPPGLVEPIADPLR